MTRLWAPTGLRGGRSERLRASSVRMVIVERGALGLDSHLSQDESDEAIVIQQCDEEHPKEWANRIIWQLTSLKRSGTRVGQCTMLIVSRADEQSIGVRSALARAVLAHVQMHGPGARSTEFLLAVSDDADAEFRRDVLALVESLVSQPGGPAVPIRVCFTSREESSTTPVGTSGVFTRSAAKGSQSEGAMRVSKAQRLTSETAERRQIVSAKQMAQVTSDRFPSGRED